LKLVVDPIPRPECAQGDCGKKKTLWKNQTQEGWPSASTSSGLRGQERGANKHHNTRPGNPAEKEKHKLMTTIMLFLQDKKREQSEQSWPMAA